MACPKPFQKLVYFPKMKMRVPIPIPCGYCSACRRDKITMWSDRLEFESIGKPSTFLTLTYNDQNLPADKSVSLDDFQQFNDRLRHTKNLPKYKYFVTSEYGSENYRPHYHIILIGLNPLSWETTKAIDSAWQQKGFFDLAPLNSARIRYTLKYMSKELRGYKKNDYELLGLKPLFHTMSKGIGKKFFFDNIDLIREHKGYYKQGKLRPLPRYYADLLRVSDVLDIHSYLDYTKKYKDFLVLQHNITYSPLYSRLPDDFFQDVSKINSNDKMDLLDDFNII